MDRDLASLHVCDLRLVLDRAMLPRKGKRAAILERVRFAVSSAKVAKARALVSLIAKLAADRRRRSAPEKKKRPDASQGGVVVDCPCGEFEAHELVACVACSRVQHVVCVRPNAAQDHYCEQCRALLSDPFWRQTNDDVRTVTFRMRAMPAVAAIATATTVRTVEREFKITEAALERLRSGACLIRVYSVWLGDAVTFRTHWPRQSGVSVNGGPVVRIADDTGRHRPWAVPVGALVAEPAVNRVVIQSKDPRAFAFALMLVESRPVADLLASVRPMAAEDLGESMAALCARVFGDEPSVRVSLTCPILGRAIRTPVRFEACRHAGCFDLHAFLQLNRECPHWTCPTCGVPGLVTDLRVCPVMTNVLSNAEWATDVEIFCDGTWRVVEAEVVEDAAADECWEPNPLESLPVVTDEAWYDAYY